jgi:hypothetical protein
MTRNDLCFLTRRFKANRHTYTLKMYETDGDDIGYRLMRTNGTIFEGRGYRPGAGIAHDSDDAVRGLMGFLTLRPGETDKEYFENYTSHQMGFALCEAEELAMVVRDRYGDE